MSRSFFSKNNINTRKRKLTYNIIALLQLIFALHDRFVLRKKRPVVVLLNWVFVMKWTINIDKGYSVLSRLHIHWTYKIAVLLLNEKFLYTWFFINVRLSYCGYVNETFALTCRIMTQSYIWYRQKKKNHFERTHCSSSYSFTWLRALYIVAFPWPIKEKRKKNK